MHLPFETYKHQVKVCIYIQKSLQKIGPKKYCMMPAFKVLGISIWAQNPTKTQNKHYSMKEYGFSCYLQLTVLKMDGGNSWYQLLKI